MHLQMYRLLWGGLVSLGLQPFVEEEADRLATVNTIKVPCQWSSDRPLQTCLLCERQLRHSINYIYVYQTTNVPVHQHTDGECRRAPYMGCLQEAASHVQLACQLHLLSWYSVCAGARRYRLAEAECICDGQVPAGDRRRLGAQRRQVLADRHHGLQCDTREFCRGNAKIWRTCEGVELLAVRSNADVKSRMLCSSHGLQYKRS